MRVPPSYHIREIHTTQLEAAYSLLFCKIKAGGNGTWELRSALSKHQKSLKCRLQLIGELLHLSACFCLLNYLAEHIISRTSRVPRKNTISEEETRLDIPDSLLTLEKVSVCTIFHPPSFSKQSCQVNDPKIASIFHTRESFEPFMCFLIVNTTFMSSRWVATSWQQHRISAIFIHCITCLNSICNNFPCPTFPSRKLGW